MHFYVRWIECSTRFLVRNETHQSHSKTSKMMTVTVIVYKAIDIKISLIGVGFPGTY